jgi:hypothetical protein
LELCRVGKGAGKALNVDSVVMAPCPRVGGDHICNASVGT